MFSIYGYDDGYVYNFCPMRGFGVGASHSSYHWWDRSANYTGSTRVEVRVVRDTVRVQLRVKVGVRHRVQVRVGVISYRRTWRPY